MNKIIRNITARLSLRTPQEESLEILADILDVIDVSKDSDVADNLHKIKNLYPSLQDFEREFPSLCFALATGVGKTRLMGAFISYLYLTGRSRHFFVLAPNLTIYDKLKQDFNPRSPKYVFKGIQEFVINQPVIITGEDYDSGKGIRFDINNFRGQGRLFENNDTPFINIFNISKINATDNKKGATKSSTPRIKRLQETIGESYFDYLANLPDLVMLMDEAHRYRATAGSSAINELKPILGIELTATPKTTGTNPIDFKNTIYAYSLSQAMEDGYVKEPAVATRKDFKPENYSAEQLEQIKLEDGIRCHETVKVELDFYARHYDKKIVKPFILVVAQDTNHARDLRLLIESDAFFDGRYKDKVIEIHSKQSGAEEDDNIQKLIAIENPNNPTEIVIHVNKLKEGWDVTNLYTIVPLRASASEILTEQTIGRGLRLPYGRRTGVESVDRLTIIAHDKFQDIIDRANDPNSIIKKKIEIGNGGDIPSEKLQVMTVSSVALMHYTASSVTSDSVNYPETLIKTPEHKRIADITIDVAKRYERLDSSSALSTPEIQEKIIKEVSEILRPQQNNLALEPDTTGNIVKEMVEGITKNIAEFTIDMPNIVLIPSRDATYGFRDFDLDGLECLNFQPISQEILIKQLRTNKSSLLSSGNTYYKEIKPENYIIRNLIDNELLDYDEHSELLCKLALQVVNRFKTYLPNESDVENVLIHYQQQIDDFIIVQLRKHYWKTPTDYQVSVNRGFTILKSFNCRVTETVNFRQIPNNKSDVKKMIFGGFSKCCYQFQQFESVDGELRFAQILEDATQVMRWIKPAKRTFQIEYKNGTLYEPDFVVETTDAKYLCEPKMASEIKDETVLAKQKAAVRWCQYATKHSHDNGGKPWHYALIPHNAITSNRSFDGLMREFVVSPELI